MQSLNIGTCNNCGGVGTEVSEGFAFYATFCPFCGRGYSSETTVDEDYYASMARREFPEKKDSYVNNVSESGGYGMVFVSVKDRETFHSDIFKNEDSYYDHHATAYCYGQGFYVELEPGEDITDMIREIEENPGINKEKSYITVYDDDGLKLMYGNTIDFNRETNYVLKDTMAELQRPISSFDYRLRNKTNESRVQIEEKILEVNRKIEELFIADILELIDLIEKAPDKEMDENSDYSDLPF